MNNLSEQDRRFVEHKVGDEIHFIDCKYYWEPVASVYYSASTTRLIADYLEEKNREFLAKLQENQNDFNLD